MRDVRIAAKLIVKSVVTYAALAVIVSTTMASSETITRIILSDRQVEKVLRPGDGRRTMMTLEQFRDCNPGFAQAELDTLVPAGTEIIQPPGDTTCVSE